MKGAEEPIIRVVRDPKTLGALVRARRKAARLTQAQAAGLAGVGNRFLSEFERGKKTLEFGLVLQVLERLGFELAVAPRGSNLFARLAPEGASRPGLGEAGVAAVPEARFGEERPQLKGMETARTKGSKQQGGRATRGSSVRLPPRGRKKPRRGGRAG